MSAPVSGDYRVRVQASAVSLLAVKQPFAIAMRAQQVDIVTLTAPVLTELSMVTPSSLRLSWSAVSGADATINWTQLTAADSYRVYWSDSARMPGSCEPTCHVIGSASSIKLSQIMSGNATGGNQTPQSGGTYYVKISAISAGSGKTITGWQSTPLKVVLP